MADNLTTILMHARQQIDSVCEAFERAFQKQPRPNLESFLQGEGPARWQLLLALVNSELELRLRQGETVRLAHYIERFPELLHFPNELSAVLLTEVKLLSRRQALILDDYQKQYPQLPVRDIFRQLGAAPPEVSGYEILNQIGQGGMGVVYRARQILLNREVAVKLIRKDRLLSAEANQSFQIRFQREAKAIAAVNHANVTQIFEAGDQDGDLYIAMELVTGPSLQTRLQSQGVLEIREAARLVSKMADAIQSVHDRGIIHRDLKPDNILLTADGEPKITDFGLARPTELPDGRTHAGCFIGTPEYSSPEQARMTGEDPTPAVDVYGLGAVLYACLTGVPPFSRETLEVTLQKVRSMPVLPVRELRPQCPKDLETICLKCLQKEPQSRYPTARELANDLDRFLDGRPVHAQPLTTAEVLWKLILRHRALSASLFASIMILSMATAVSLILANLARKEAAKAREAERKALYSESIARQSMQSLATTNQELEIVNQRTQFQRAAERFGSGKVGGLLDLLSEVHPRYRKLEWNLLRSIAAPDTPSQIRQLSGVGYLSSSGNLIAATADTTDPSDPYGTIGTISIHRASDLQKRAALRAFSSGLTCFDFLPDDERIVTGSRDYSINIIDIDDGTILKTFSGHLAEPVSVAASSDGTRILSKAKDGSLKLWDIESGLELLSINNPSETTLTPVSNDRQLLFNPTGRSFVDIHSQGRDFQIRDAITGEVMATCHNPGQIFDIVFDHSGQRIMTVADAHVIVWDAVSGKRLESLRGSGSALSSICLSEADLLLFTGTFDGSVEIWDLASRARTDNFDVGLDSVACLSLSEGDSRLICCDGSRTIEKLDLRRATIGSDFAIITDTAGSLPSEDGAFGVQHVSFSKDGTSVVMARGNGNVCHRNLETCQVTSISEYSDVIGISPCGSIVAYSDGSEVEICRASDRARLCRLTGHEEPVVSGAFCGDGSLIATAAYDSSIRIWDVDSGKELHKFSLDVGNAVGLSFAPEKPWLLVCCFDSVKLYDAQAGIVLWEDSSDGNDRYRSGSGCFSWNSDSFAIAYHDGIEIRRSDGFELMCSIPAKAADPWTQICFSRDDYRLISGHKDGEIRVWDIKSGNLLLEFQHSAAQRSPIEFVKVHPSGEFFVTASGYPDPSFKVWSTGSEALLELDTDAEGILQVTLDATGVLQAVCSTFEICVLDAKTCELLTTFQGHDEPVTALCVTAEGDFVVSGSRDSSLYVWGLQTGEARHCLIGHQAEITCVDVSLGSGVVVSGSADQTVRVWNAETGKECFVLAGHEGRITSLCTSSDDRLICSGGGDNTVRVWDVGSGSLVRVLEGHRSPVVCVQYSQDGKYLVSADQMKHVRLWDAASYDLLSESDVECDEIVGLAFSSDGNNLGVFDIRGHCEAWNVHTKERLASTLLHETQWALRPGASAGRILAVTFGREFQFANVDTLHLYETGSQDQKRRNEVLLPRYHRQQAERLEGSKDWQAALFHRAWVMTLQPSDAWNFDELHKCYEASLSIKKDVQIPCSYFVAEALKLPRGNEQPRLSEESAAKLNERIWNENGPGWQAEKLPFAQLDIHVLQDICGKYPTDWYYNTLGVLQYRVGDYDSAVGSLRKSDMLRRAAGAVESSLEDLVFLALSHHALGQVDEAIAIEDEFYRQIALKQSPVQHQWLRQEFRDIYRGRPSIATVEEFNRAGTMEEPLEQWWAAEREDQGSCFQFDSKVCRSGDKSLRVDASASKLVAHHFVEVKPNTRYRFTGWVRARLENPPTSAKPLDGLGRQDGHESQAVGTPGVRLCNLDAGVSSETVDYDSEWRPIAFEFQTTDSQTQIKLSIEVDPELGFDVYELRFSDDFSAWFDDLSLVELSNE